MTGLEHCETDTCNALLSTKEYVEYYTVTSKEKDTTEMAPIEHYIVTSKGEEVTSVPEGKMKDMVIRIQLSGFRALVVFMENCGKKTCRMTPSCEHGGVKISVAQKNPKDERYMAPEIAVFPRIQDVEVAKV
ncbi:hypothetical protein BCIN_05g02890 [Botrytis cinerea B05.10]|uniref:Uncharacterized protein n=1 Tax=Botryotinia fuckeliana (strain B05.10) TaxID=332648 RepID=A0A384JH59_BOTFB|nr:hypothetical protein BCIN_05g02890 [Botrytis cinerea B05.10]ATZ49890.1 hypothetical protein BCIN_05g02890 [Botrytis cinerea B05.10]